MTISCQAYYSLSARLSSLLSRREDGDKLLSKPQVRNLGLLVFGLFASGCSQLTQIASRVPVLAGVTAALERIERFLKNEAVDPITAYEPVARLLLSRFQGGSVRIILDATQVNGRVFMLFVALAYRGRALPLAWCMLGRDSVSSTTAEQVALLERVGRLIAEGTQVVLLGDREYATVALIEYCLKRQWCFCLRAKKSRTVLFADGTRTCLGALDLCRGQRRYFKGVSLLEPKQARQAKQGMRVQLVCGWSAEDADDEPWFLLTNLPADAHVLSLYRTRFWIEEMFRDFKEQGFRLERTRVRVAERLSRLLLGLCLAYVWLVNAGIWVSKRRLRPQVDRRRDRQLSWFQVGLRYLQHLLVLNKDVPCTIQAYR